MYLAGTFHNTGNTLHYSPWFHLSSKSIFTFFSDENGTVTPKIDGLLSKLFALSDAIDDYSKKNNIAGFSIVKFIRYLVECKGSVIATQGAMLLLRAATIALNVAFAGFVTLLVTKAVSAWQNYIQRTENAVKKSQEAVQKANQLKSSLKDISESYEKLGDKASWDTSDFDQAKDIQEELLELLKDQDGISKDKIDKIDLQNGKYEEQLELLRQIRLEQLQGETSDLVQNKDNQGKLLEKVAKEQAHDNHSVDSFDSEMAEELANRFGWDYNEDSGVLNFNNYDPDNADSVVRHYNELGQALDIITKKYSDADRAASGLYDAFKNDRAGIKDQVDAYNDAVSALKQNKFASDFAEWSANETKKPTQATSEIDAKIKATKEYQDAVKEAQKTEEEWNSQGYGKYGNIDNFHRDKIDWTEENKKKYPKFVAENPDVTSDDYSTVIGQWEYLSKYADVADEKQIFTFSPMLQTDSGLVPLTNDQLTEYLHNIVQQAADKNGKVDIDKLMELDATGLKQDINGVMMQVKGMIAGVAGGKDPNGGVYSTADILAISGDYNKDIKKDLIGIYGSNADLTPIDDDGNLSRYVGKSMHDAQETAQNGKDQIEAVYNQLYSDLENGSSGESDGSSSAPVRYVDHIKSAFDILADSLGKDSGEMTISDVVGLSQDGVQLTDEQAQALDTLTAAANKYGTTIQGVAEAGEENGLFGGIEDATNRAIETAKDMETLSQQIDNIQKAYKSCSTAVDEYNKYGYMSADALQSLLSMDYEYLSCMELVNGKLVLNNEAFAQMVASKYADAKVTAVQNAIAEIQKISLDNVKTSTEKATEAMDGEVNKLNELSPGLGDAIKGTVGLATAQELLNAAEEKSEIDPDRVQTILDGLNTQLSVIDSTIDTILGDSSKIKNHLNGFNKNNKSHSASKSVTDVASAFDTLTKAMKEYNQYGYISADTMKSMMKLEDKFTSCLVKNGDKLEINANEFRKLVETQLKEEEASGKASKSADELKRVLSYLDNNVHSSTISFEQLTDVIKGYGTAMDEAKEKTDAIKSAFSGLSEVMNNKTDRNNPFGLLDSDDVEKQHEALLQLAKDTDVFKSKAYNPETGEVDFNSKAFKDSVVEYLNGMADAAAQTGGAGAKAIEKNWRDAAKAIADGKISVEEFYNGLGYSLEKATKEIDDFQSGFSDITDIVDEYNLYGGLSIDNYQKLMALSPEYLSCLKLEGDQLVFNEAAYKQLLIDKLNDMITTYEQTDATKALADRLRELRDGLLNSKTGFKSAKDAAEEFKSAMSDLKEILSSVLSIFEKFNDKSNNDLKIWGDTMNKVIDKRIEALNKQKEALEENNEATERAIELSKAQDALARAQQQRTTRVYTENGYEWQANAEDVRTAREDLADKQREWNKKDAEKAIDDQIKKYNEFKDKLSEVMDDIGKSWKDYQKELEYTAQIQKMSLSQMEGSLDSYHNKIIASLNTGSAITSIQNLITNLESLINTLIKVNNLYSMLKNGSYKDQGLSGLWNTVKGFFNKGGTEATNESANVVENFFNVLKNKAQTSGNGLVETFKGIWDSIKLGAQNLFHGSGDGGGLISTFVNGFKAIGGAVKNSKIGSAIINGGSKVLGALGNAGSAIVSGGGKLLAGAGKLVTTAGSALAAAGPYAIPLVAAAGLGIYGGVKSVKHQKEIWSNKEDGFGKKAIKSVATFFWDMSPVGMIVNLCKDISGKSKKTAENTKDTAKNTSETAENTKNQQSVTNLTINATQIVSKEENKVSDATGNEDQTTADEDKTFKTAATTLTGAGLGAAAGMAIGGPAGAFIGGLLGGLAGFFLGRHANGLKSSKTNHFANVDERGSELIVRQPASGRYTYLETGDGVVPADITSRLFEMGGNPDKWFSDQLAKHGSASIVQSRDSGGISLSIGDVNVNNPIGDSDALARELVNRLPNKVVQELNRR